MSDNNLKSSSNITWIIFSIILAIGLIFSSFIISSAVKGISSANDTISVKGLAEKQVKADLAVISIDVYGENENDVELSYKDLESTREQIISYLKEKGINNYSLSPETSRPIYKSIRKKVGNDIVYEDEFQYYQADQKITIESKDVDAIYNLYVESEKIFKIKKYSANINPPQFLLSKLEEIKMSLIKGATDNAYLRAKEFAKSGKITIGNMRSARQGPFYILAEGDEQSDEDYGGIYDKKTINKTAKVVVTINYAIK